MLRSRGGKLWWHLATFTNQGVEDVMRVALAGGGVPSYTVLLFITDVTPGPTTVFADLVECNTAGYARQPLAPGNWTISVAAGLATCVYPTLTFNFAANSGGVTVYGYMVLNVAGGGTRTAWGERFATPFPIAAAGGNLTVDLSDYAQAR